MSIANESIARWSAVGGRCRGLSVGGVLRPAGGRALKGLPPTVGCGVEAIGVREGFGAASVGRAWPGLSRMKGDEESREPSQPGPFDFSTSLVSPLSSRVHHQRYGVFCLSHESCRSAQDFPLVENGTDCPIGRCGWRSERNRGAARSDRLGGGGWRRVRVRGGRRPPVCRRYCAGDSLRFAR
jgi:hypothetical protein